MLYTGVAVLAFGATIYIQSASILSDDSALQRLKQTDVSDEDRTQELRSLFEYIGWHSVFGLGNGSGFPSPTEKETDNFAAYPHLSIFAPFQKGGMPAMVVLIIVPLVMLSIVLFHKGASPLQQQAATSALLFLLFSCLSGTWVFPFWVFFGIAEGYCFYGKSGMVMELEMDDKLIEVTQ